MSLIPSFFLSLTCGLFTSSFFPSRSFRYLLRFSTLTSGSGSYTSSFRFEPFISLYIFSFSFYIRFVYLLLLSSHASLSSRPSFRCNSTLRFVTSFQFVSALFNGVRYFFPFRFNSSLLFPIPRSFRFKLFSSLRYFLAIVSTLPSCSLSWRSFC